MYIFLINYIDIFIIYIIPVTVLWFPLPFGVSDVMTHSKRSGIEFRSIGRPYILATARVCPTSNSRPKIITIRVRSLVFHHRSSCTVAGNEIYLSYGCLISSGFGRATLEAPTEAGGIPGDRTRSKGQVGTPAENPKCLPSLRGTCHHFCRTWGIWNPPCYAKRGGQ